MNSNEIIATVNKIINLLAQKFGVGVKSIYPVLLQQAKRDMVMDIIWCSISIITILFICIFNKYVYKYLKIAKLNDEDSQMIIGTSIVISIILCLISIIILISCGNEIIQIKMSPNYYIFKDYIYPLIPGNN